MQNLQTVADNGNTKYIVAGIPGTGLKSNPSEQCPSVMKRLEDQTLAMGNVGAIPPWRQARFTL